MPNRIHLVVIACLSAIGLAGCSGPGNGLSSFSNTDQIVEKLVESGIPCYDPDSSPNYNMNARELICHDSKGDGYWIYLFDTPETMAARYETPDCDVIESATGWGANWYFEGGLGSQGVGLERIVSALGGKVGTYKEFLGCPTD